MTDSEFSGRVAVITGGGRGFGQAFGRALAERGAHAVLVDVDLAAAEQAAERLRQSGGSAQAYGCDVSDEPQVAAVFDAVADFYGGIDVLINNAGLHSAEYNQSMATLGVARLRRLFDVNVMGVVVCSLAARPHLAGRPGACILNISSAAAYGASTAYGASKLAVRGLTITTAHEFGADGIRVNALAPGLHLTDTIRAELSPETIAWVKAQQILDLDGAESDVVEAALYLCSDRARFVTGETLRVSGGFALTI
jgi:NAD(P)-dependent dehydrogenase (short-subunit alcohol dehydrogenase family)